ncbi:MAG TPA: hypothetical protein VMF66_19490 [Candidatus Acidoferrum sp.]|nr:hypothetical protein [Candidatus Acidoferrum sp.]
MSEVMIGAFLVVLALFPGAKFYPGRFGRKQGLPPIEPGWILRLFFVGVRLMLVVGGVQRLRNHAPGWLP